jgi:AbrB family looped-hinge helix DNA binding protein
MAPSQAEIRVGAQGRVVIPVELRRELNIDQGETLVARVDADRLILEKRESVLKRLQSRFASVPSTVSLADELIAERRAEASLE